VGLEEDCISFFHEHLWYGMVWYHIIFPNNFINLILDVVDFLERDAYCRK